MSFLGFFACVLEKELEGNKTGCWHSAPQIMTPGQGLPPQGGGEVGGLDKEIHLDFSVREWGS